MTNNPEGSRSVGAAQNRVLTLDGKVAWNRAISSSLTSGLVVGMQVFNDRSESTTGSALDLPGPGIEVVGAGGRNIATGESFATGINGGYFAQEQLGFKNWVFLTLGGRYDFASAFGEESPGVFYPKASLSVVPSDLTGWSAPFGINTLRLRVAMGQSGRAPGGFDKFTTFAPLRAELGAGLAPSQLGNQNLKPEIATEIEGGFEVGLLADRLGLNATIWSRKVEDLLIDQQFAPSGGFRRAQIANIGSMEGNGYELGARAFVLSTPRIGVELFANAAYMKQTITSLGPGSLALHQGRSELHPPPRIPATRRPARFALRTAACQVMPWRRNHPGAQQDRPTDRVLRAEPASDQPEQQRTRRDARRAARVSGSGARPQDHRRSERASSVARGLRRQRVGCSSRKSATSCPIGPEPLAGPRPCSATGARKC